jgi:hypothetical protein
LSASASSALTSLLPRRGLVYRGGGLARRCLFKTLSSHAIVVKRADGMLALPIAIGTPVRVMKYAI